LGPINAKLASNCCDYLTAWLVFETFRESWFTSE
jgi:hypothetical protein